MANEFDAGLDATFVLGIAHWGGNGLEEVLPGESKKRRIELHRGAHMMQNDAFQVVIDDAPRNTTKEGERTLMHTQKSIHALVEGKVDVKRSRPAQNHGKSGQWVLGVVNPPLSKRAPVDLGLLTRLGLDAQVRFARPRGTDLCNIAPQNGNSTGESLVLKL